jgi:hypothetical protein
VNPVFARHLFLFGLLIAASIALLFLGARLGDRKWARRRELKRLATPPFTPARRDWVDEYERPF